ncbi:MAG: hypothetical protein PHE24_03210 [Patescibacteria group bacterium]|nr:hypothetical protein [Patescibacteria group bacterium]
MILKIDQPKKIFIVCAIATAVVLCAYSLISSIAESEKSALAQAKNVTVQIKTGNYQIGKKYSVSWDSDCRAGEAMVWLATASSSKANIGILVPLANFSAANFGDQGKDARIFFNDPWKFNLSHNANRGKLSWTVPTSLALSKSLFKSEQGVFYLYTLADGRFALHKIVKEPVRMPVMPEKYYLRVDIKGKNGCTATGYSAKINVINNK